MERNNRQSKDRETLQSRERQWQKERQTLLKTISLLEQELKQQKAMNAALLKKSKHKRTSSQQQTFIFNQTNISSYYPVVVVKSHSWNHKATLRSHLDSVRALSFTGQHLVTASEDATLKVWKKDKLEQTVRQHLGPIYTLAASEDVVFTGGAEGVVRKWTTDDLIKGQPPIFEQQYHEQPIWSLAYNEKCQLLLSSSADQSITLLKNDATKLGVVWQNKLEADTPTVVEWMADNRFIAGYRNKHAIGVYQVEEGELGWEYVFEGKAACSQVNCLKMGTKLKMIAAGHEDHFIRFYDPNSNKKIKEIAAHSDAVTGVHFRGDGFQFLSTGHDGNLRVWDLRKYRCVSDTTIHVRKYDEGALCLAINRDNLLAVGGADGAIKLMTQGE